MQLIQGFFIKNGNYYCMDKHTLELKQLLKDMPSYSIQGITNLVTVHTKYKEVLYAISATNKELKDVIKPLETLAEMMDLVLGKIHLEQEPERRIVFNKAAAETIEMIDTLLIIIEAHAEGL